MGNDGFLNFTEINSPKTANLNYLDLFDTRSFFFNWGIKSKINNTIFQSIGIKYQNNHINFQRIIPEVFTFSVSGFHGIIAVFCLNNNNS